MLILFLSFYTFQNYNQNFHALEKSEFDFKIYELNDKSRWLEYKKDSNLSAQRVNKEIKSVLIFKKSGSLFLNFSFQKKDINSSIAYEILKNQKIMDKFVLKVEEKHQTHLELSSDDVIEIHVTIEKTGSYWGQLETSFQASLLYVDALIILFIWLLFMLFLLYKNYGYLALLSYFIFSLMIVAEYLNFGRLTFELILNYTFLVLLWTLLMLGTYQLFSRLKRFKIASILLFLLCLLLVTVPLLFLLYSLNFDHPLSQEALYAVFQSNSNESVEYVEKFIKFPYLLLFFATPLFMGFLIHKQERIVASKINTPLMVIMTFILSITLCQQVSNFRLPNFILEHFDKYNEELKLFHEVQAKRTTGELKFRATKMSKGETHIVVIGESLNKNHMGIYGYIRDTTPHLSKMLKEGKLLLFTNTYSNHTHTVPVLSLALTEANQYNHKNYYESLSIVEILKKAKLETYWLSNQNIYGEWDNMVSVLATGADKLIALNHTIGCSVQTQQYDEALIEPLEAIFSQPSSKNRVVFIHLMGSHSVYGSRYPEEKFSIFTKDLNATVFGKSALINQELNRYDNTIVYNDYVVSSLLKAIQKQKGVASFTYISDHADDINRDLGHSKDHFTYEMTQIPFLLWFSDEYIKKYPKKYGRLLHNRDRLFSNDMLYDTLIGLFEIETEKYNQQYDLSSKAYNLNPKDALVLHGKRHYTEASNHSYWQKVNLAYLREHKLLDRVIPCNIATIGTHHQVVDSGFSKFLKEKKCKETKTLSLGDVDFIEKLSKALKIIKKEDEVLVYYESDFNP